MSREIFLVSSPFAGRGEPFSNQNHFLDKFKQSLTDCKRLLLITSDPENVEFTQGFFDAIYYTMEHSGIKLPEYNILDGRNMEDAGDLVPESGCIVLAGGHVPTQNSFFRAMGLRDLLRDYHGVILGISAGSMNSADVVYAQPEEEGEGIDPQYEKFLTGLNLTKHMILPHYQDTKDGILDGKRIFEDITYPDSFGREFYALPDGSYLYIKDGKEVICGEAYLIKDGQCQPICSDKEEYVVGRV